MQYPDCPLHRGHVSKPFDGVKFWNGPLIRAIATGEADEIVRQIEASDDVNAPDRTGLTPLIWAVIQDAPKVVEWLWLAEARIDKRDAAGRTALCWAAMLKRQDIFEFLRLRCGASPYGVDNECWRVVDYAAVLFG